MRWGREARRSTAAQDRADVGVDAGRGGCRSPDEVASLTEAIGGLCEPFDLRTHALVSGALEALAWVERESTTAPFGLEVPAPTLAQVHRVREAAVRMADGQTLEPRGWVADGLRIYARGIDECLSWWTTPSYPLPVWGTPGVDELVVVVHVIGDVGRGIDITKATNGAAFPYRPADLLPS